MNFLKKLFGKGTSSVAVRPNRVSFDDVAILHVRGDDSEERIAWADLIEVGVLTTDEGPFAEDVFFMLLGPTIEQGICIPQGAEGTQQLIARLQQLPSFDDTALIKAMGSTDNNRFVCWRKPNPNSPPP